MIPFQLLDGCDCWDLRNCPYCADTFEAYASEGPPSLDGRSVAKWFSGLFQDEEQAVAHGEPLADRWVDAASDLVSVPEEVTAYASWLYRLGSPG
jgi:hypothetical protein